MVVVVVVVVVFVVVVMMWCVWGVRTRQEGWRPPCDSAASCPPRRAPSRHGPTPIEASASDPRTRKASAGDFRTARRKRSRRGDPPPRAVLTMAQHGSRECCSNESDRMKLFKHLSREDVRMKLLE